MANHSESEIIEDGTSAAPQVQPIHVRLAEFEHRRFSLPAEAAIVVGVLLVWQAARIPLRGGAKESIAHAHEWLTLQRTLGLVGLQNRVIALVHHPGLIEAARWSYANLHVFGIFTFMVALRAAAPERYPRVRSAFVLLHIPALIAIGLFPLAPPLWLPHPPEWTGGVPPVAGLSAALRDQTAAVASEHFGYPVLMAAGTLWAARGRPVALMILLYPLWVFLVIVGTGHHYPLDAIVGTLCVAFGFAAARVLHRPAHETPGTPMSPRQWVPLAVGSGLVAGWVDGLVQGRVHVGPPSPLTFAAPVAAAAAFGLARAGRRAGLPLVTSADAGAT